MPLKLTPLEIKLLRLWMDRSALPGESANAALHLRRLLRDRGIDAYMIETLLSESWQQPARIYQPARENPYASTVLAFGKHRGKRLDQVPPDYLLWCLENFSTLWPTTRRAIEMYLNL